MRSCVLGLPADRSGVYGQIQDWCQAHGLGVYEPHRRRGEGTLFNEWNGTGFGFRPETVALLRKVKEPLMWHVGSYYYASKPEILRRALPMLWAMREALADMGVEHPWLLVDEPPHAERYGWTQQIEDDVVAFVAGAQSAGWRVGVAVPGPSQYSFWKERIQPGRWVLHAKHEWDVSGDVWLYNAETVTGLAARLAAAGASGYLQWSAVRTTKQGPVPILFNEAGQPTEAGLRLVEELAYVAPTQTLAEQVTALQGEVAELRRRVQTLEGKAPAPVTKAQPVDLALFYASDAAGWQRELGRLAKYPQAVIQADLSAVTADSSGNPYANGQTPLRYLEDRGVQTWLYVSPWWLWTATGFGKGEWLRKVQVALADNAKAWLRDKQGVTVPVFGGKMRVVDPRATAYVDALAEAMLALPHYRFFLDNTFYHQGAYHRWLVPDDVWHEAACRLYDRLRSAGKQVILNGGWEMADPTANVWQWPLREHCDGVAVEIPAMFTGPAGQWTLFDYAPMDTAALEHVALDWQLAGKVVFVIARHKRSEPVQTDDSPFPDLARHRTWWRSLAKAKNFSVSAQTSYNAIPEREDD